MNQVPHIVCVDDNEQSRILMSDLLSYHGYYVTTYSSGESFLQSNCVETMDLLFLDICMPQMSGTDCLLMLQDREIVKVPVIALTALALKDEISELLTYGFHEIITKPIDIQLIAKEVAKLCPIH